MPINITRDDVRTLVAEGAQLVEVLPAVEYEEEHLPAALNIPLRELTRESVSSRLQKNRPIIVYCHDYQ